MKKILIIEDDEEMCSELSEILINKGFSTTIANDGAKGISLIENGEYDLILLDLKLPKINGRAIIKKTKAQNPDLKIIVITGSPIKNNLPEDKENPSLIDPDDPVLKMAAAVIIKPFNIETVLKKIREIAEL